MLLEPVRLQYKDKILFSLLVWYWPNSWSETIWVNTELQ